MSEQVKKHSRHIWAWVLFGILLLLIVLRIVIPGLLTSMANSRLEKESPYFSFHIRDIDFHILKGKYVVQGITGKIKKTNEQFLNIAFVQASIPWGNVFKGHAVADVVVDRLNLSASQSLVDYSKLEAERLKQKYPPEEKDLDDNDSGGDDDDEPRFSLNSFALRNSNVTIHDFMSFKGNDTRKISDIDVVVKNLTPTKTKPVTDFLLNANVFGPAPLLVRGNAHLTERPMKFDTNTVLKNFDLRSINPFIREKVQAYIHKGKMDLYAEAEGTPTHIEGYAKPFVSKFRMDTPPGGFQFTGAAAASGGNLVKILLTDSEAKTLATKAPFTFDQQLEIDIIPILELAVVHKIQQNIQPGLEDTVGQKGLGIEAPVREAQEANE